MDWRRLHGPQRGPHGAVTVLAAQLVRVRVRAYGRIGYGVRVAASRRNASRGRTRHISDAFSDSLRANHEVRSPADTDERSPKEYQVRTCSGGRPMFLGAAQPSVLDSVNHSRRPRLSARLLQLYGDGEMAAENSDVAEPFRHHALVLGPQVSRSRQAGASIHREMRKTSHTSYRSWHSPIRRLLSNDPAHARSGFWCPQRHT